MGCLIIFSPLSYTHLVFLFIYLFFNWRIITLENFVVFCQTSTLISYRCAYVPSLLNLLPISLFPTYLIFGCPVWHVRSYFPTRDWTWAGTQQWKQSPKQWTARKVSFTCYFQVNVWVRKSLEDLVHSLQLTRGKTKAYRAERTCS